MGFTGQVALVTGGARGAGQGIALSLARAGCDVVIADLLAMDDVARAAERTVALIEQEGRKALALSCDVRDEAALTAVVDEATRALGPLEHVVVNAGVIEQGDVDTMPVEAWQRVVDVNLTGAWLTCRAVAPQMKQRRSGTITVISSVAASRGGAGYTAYCATKAGTLGMVRALAHELAACDVRVNAVLPGYLGTDMWFRSILGGAGDSDEAARNAFEEVVRTSVPLGRPQTAQDLGDAVVYLAGATNVTGAELVVDGGRLAGP